MFPKLLTLTLFLLSATAFSQAYVPQNNPALHEWQGIDDILRKVLLESLDPQESGFAYDLIDSLPLQNISPEDGLVYEAGVKFLSFTEGFLKGTDNAEVFSDTIGCLEPSRELLLQLDSAAANIASPDPSKVNDAIVQLGQTTEFILNAVRYCKVPGADLEKLTRLVETFKNPTSFIIHQGRSLMVNNVEIVFEAAHILEAYREQDYSTMGYWIGKAMDSIVKGFNKKLSPEFAEFLNNVNQWQAAVPTKFQDMTFEEIRNRFLGSQAIDYSKLDNLTEFNYQGHAKDIPDSFNCSEVWPSCIHPIRDQGQCGSCWAFAASEVISDRFCIASNGTVQVVLSPQYLISCDKPLSLGCHGGVPLFSWWFIINQGLVTDDCLPYLAYNGSNPLKCEDFKQCQDGSPIKKYYGLNESAVVLHNPESIQANMMQYGPIDAAFIVYEDFMYYSGGVYKHSTGGIVGLHSVKITGWGTENGENYWIVANSWGTAWGENGFFKIAFGQCGIDSATATGRPDLSRLPNNSENRFW